MKRIDHYWNDLNGVSLLLMPISWVFALLVLVRRFSYRIGLFKTTRLPVPVIVVGNITVGGSGKTPLVIWLTNFLKQAGYRPGIISRGYGGMAGEWPQPVTSDSDPRQVGDEPVLIVKRTNCPMRVGADRVAAARALLDEESVDLIISDDGMQHYSLERDIEVAVIDGERRFQNSLLLPAGPLREPVSRLKSVDLLITNGGESSVDEYPMVLEIDQAVSLYDDTSRTLSELAGMQVHAVAGIGHPQRFFNALREYGIEVFEHPYPDHHNFALSDIAFDDELPVLMTEKDGVKCSKLRSEKLWQVPVSARMPEQFGDVVQNLLKR